MAAPYSEYSVDVNRCLFSENFGNTCRMRLEQASSLAARSSLLKSRASAATRSMPALSWSMSSNSASSPWHPSAGCLLGGIPAGSGWPV
jgi:hypothetical protein